MTRNVGTKIFVADIAHENTLRRGCYTTSGDAGHVPCRIRECVDFDGVVADVRIRNERVFSGGEDLVDRAVGVAGVQERAVA